MLSFLHEHVFVLERRQVMRRYITLISALILTASGCTKATEEAPPLERTYPVRVVSVERGDLQESVPALGTIAWERQVKIRSQVAGVVHEISPAEGSEVRDGEVLTRIIAPEMRARLEQIDAELRRAQAERDYVCANHETDRRLGEAGALESARVDISRKGCTTASEAVRGLEARRVEARTGMAKLVEKAPEAGLLLEWSVEPGEFVGPGQPLALLGAGSPQIVVLVPEVDIQKGIALDTKVLVHLGDRTLVSKVAFVSSLTKGPSRSLRLEIPWPAEAKPPAAGSSVELSLVLREAKAGPIVPAEAIFERDGAHWVTIVDGGRARAQKVEPTLRSGGRVALDAASFNAEKVVISRPGAVPEAAELFVVEVL